MCAGHIDAMNALDAQGFYNVNDETRAKRHARAVEFVRERDRLYESAQSVDAVDPHVGGTTE